MVRRHYSIWDEIRRIQEEMDVMFENFFGGSPFGRGFLRPALPGPESSKGPLMTSDYRHPLADIYETDKNIVAEVEIPGVNKNDIKVNVRDGYLEIKAEKKQEKRQEDKKTGTYQYERKYSGFYRSIPLPEGVNEKEITGSYKDGVLKLEIPKPKGQKLITHEVKIN